MSCPTDQTEPSAAPEPVVRCLTCREPLARIARGRVYLLGSPTAVVSARVRLACHACGAFRMIGPAASD